MKIELQDTTKIYDDIKIVNNISLRITQGEKVCILGRSGSGKTILLKLIAGLLKPTTGIIKFDGVENVSIQDRAISFLTTNPVLFEEKSVLSNLQYARKTINSNCDLENILTFFNLDMIKNCKVKKISKFQKKVICIARAKIKQPKVLLLDDFYDGVKQEEKEKLEAYLHPFFEDKSLTIIATAKNEDAQKYDNFDYAIMKNGVYFEQNDLNYWNLHKDHLLLYETIFNKNRMISGELKYQSDMPVLISRDGNCIMFNPRDQKRIAIYFQKINSQIDDVVLIFDKQSNQVHLFDSFDCVKIL